MGASPAEYIGLKLSVSKNKARDTKANPIPHSTYIYRIKMLKREKRYTLMSKTSTGTKKLLNCNITSLFIVYIYDIF